MKKLCLLFGLMICMVAGAVETAQSYAIYNFKASFYRIETYLKSISAEGVNPKHLSYTKRSDTLKGYLVVPECCDAIKNGACAGCGEVNEFGNDQYGDTTAYLYLYLGSDSKQKTNWVKIKVADIYATMFGRGYNSTYVGTSKENAVFKLANQASLRFTCGFAADIFPKKKYVDGNGVREMDYGMLGLTCLDGYIEFAGFGACSPIIQTTYECSFCVSKENTIKCARITSISGSMTGEFNYGNIAICDTCDEAALTDPCAYYNFKYAAPVNGTWTIKYNTSASKMGFYKLEDFETFITLPKTTTRVNVIDGTMAMPE